MRLSCSERRLSFGVRVRLAAVLDYCTRIVITYWELQSHNGAIQDSSGGLRVAVRDDQTELVVGDEVEASGLRL